VKPLIFNATPLIYLTKAGLSTVFVGLQGEKVTSPTVKTEVVDEGKRKGVPDAIALEKLFENDVFKVCKPKDESFLSRLLKTRGLHKADAEVLALARERDGFAVIDDEVARKTAKVYGIDYVGSPYVLMRAVCEGIISKDTAKQALNDMVFVGWRCSVESYAKITEVLEKIQVKHRKFKP
jgi:predicted nucleic acid-binding protein